jgi:hypothetical protein
MKVWCELYKSGLSLSKIAKQFHTSNNRIHRFLIKNNIPRRSISQAISFLPANEILTQYNTGVSARMLAKKYNSTITSITDLLKRHNIVSRKPNQTRANWSFIYNHDNFFFYWLGWILTDGYISYKKVGGRFRGVVIGITTQTSDSHVLELFKSRIGPYSSLIKLKNARTLILSISRKDARYLEEWGLIQRKSLVLKPTERLLNLSHENFFQFLIGLIEGDGHITKDGSIEYTSGSYDWIKFIASKLDIKFTGHNGSYRIRLGKHRTYLLYHQYLKHHQYKLLNRKWERIAPHPFFFEDELKYKSYICKSIMMHKLGETKSQITLRPQKCKIELSQEKLVSSLYDREHLQGSVQARYHISIKYEEEIVAAMSIRRPCRQNSGDWEIARMVCNRNYKIHGLWSFVWKWVLENLPIKGRIVTFSDNRYSFGNVYSNINFKFDGFVDINYYWMKDGIRYNKQSLRKTRDERQNKKTETQLRQAEGYSKVYDLGKIRWTYYSFQNVGNHGAAARESPAPGE